MYERQIATGIKWLENQGIDWRGQLRGKNLDLGNPSLCVLGHIFGSYADYIIQHNRSAAWAREHGFLLTRDDLAPSLDPLSFEETYAQGTREYARLTTEWLNAIYGETPIVPEPEKTESPVPDYVPDYVPDELLHQEYVTRFFNRPFSPISILTGV